MTTHQTTTHHGERWGRPNHSTWCDTCNWTHTTTKPQDAQEAATNHEKENQWKKHS